MTKNKYTNLISNTLVFGISTFGSKFIVLLLRRVITGYLDPGQLGIAETIVGACNLILPIMYLCIAESVIRFGMEDSYKKNDIFSVGIFTVLAGYLILWCFYPLIDRMHTISSFESLEGYTYLIYIYVLTSALRTVITQFVRASGFVRLFALDGLFTTIATLTFTLLFIIKFEMGITGYVLATVVADGLSALCLFLLLKLYKFIRIKGIDLVTLWDMFRYSLPMVPTAVSWWFTNLSGRFFILYHWGKHINGLYTNAAVIPNTITLVSTVFTQAWQLSAFSEYKSKEGAKFFSNIFCSYYTFIFIAASGLILFVKPLTLLLAHKDYYASWQYAPFLILGVGFSCLVTFLGAIYNAAKKNVMVSVTTLIGAGISIALNLILIPRYGAIGASIATFVSFFTVFIIRAFDTRKYIKIEMQPVRIIFSVILLILQAVISVKEWNFAMLWQVIIFVLLILCNFGHILFLLRRLIGMIPTRRGKAV